MLRFILIILLLIPPQVKPDYPLKNGKPTSRGIDLYIEENAERLVEEYQDFIRDTIYNAWIYSEDLSSNGYYDPYELGRYYPNEVFITNAEVFIAYELAALTSRGRDTLNNTNLFVKSAVFHELTHHYIYQLGIEMLHTDSVEVDRAYQSFFRIYSTHPGPGPNFIEEGLCEYVCAKMGEIISPKKVFIPQRIEEIELDENRYKVFYKYSSFYLESFLDTTGLKRGIKTLLHNRPPSPEEILEPDLFFARLELID
jgi:hypothetical protein